MDTNDLFSNFETLLGRRDPGSLFDSKELGRLFSNKVTMDCIDGQAI